LTRSRSSKKDAGVFELRYLNDMQGLAHGMRQLLRGDIGERVVALNKNVQWTQLSPKRIFSNAIYLAGVKYGPSGN
jgi:hypothetical protein